MYRNQFRPDRFNEHTNTARRPGRGCASGTHHWVVSGGRGNAAPGARPRSPPNRSVRPGTVQQYRPRSPACVVPQGNTPVENAADTRTEPVNQASLGSLEKQKPPNVPHQSDVLNLDSAKGARAADSSTPTIHSEGHPSTAFTLQFGTLSPGVINTQCDPCSASAPSDINEKKHEKEQQKQEATDNRRTDLIDKYDSVPATASSNSCKVPEPELPQTPVLHSAPPADKVCMDSCKVFPRNPSSPTHQQWQKQDTRKDMISVSQSDTVNKYPAMKPRMSVQIPPPYTPNVAPPPFILPVNGRPLPVNFQQKQPQVPVEFRGPGIQMQPIGSVSGSLPMKMAMPMGNAPHVPPFFVHGSQPGALQQPAFIHQGQGLGCAPPASPHLSQLGNMRITQELPQQQPRSCDEQKRTVRITHPDTHEELMLNRRGHSYMDAASGQMPLHNMNQLAQPVPTFSPLQKVYYGPNVYNTGHIYLPNASTVPVSNRQMCPKMHPSRHTFDPTINNQAITSISPPVPNPWLDASSRPPTNLRSSSEVSNFKGLLSSDLSAPSQGALKPPTSSLVGKNEFSSQTSIPTCMAQTPTSLKFSGEANLKLPAAKSGVHCSTSPHSVLAQQAQSSPALVDHATSVAGPQIINLTQACVAHGTSSVQAKPMVVEESSPAPTVTSSCGAKGQLHHIVPLQSETSLDTEASVGSKNSKYEGNSILGKPPLLYTQEVLSPKFPTTSLFTEDLKDKVNQIFDKALMEPTFCEMYASFCFSLAGELPNFVKDDEKITFKRLLLNKCQEEFERGEREQAEADKAEEEGGIKQSKGEREEKRLQVRRRMLGNIRLIGELYKKKMLTERIMHECIKKLLGEYQHPDEEDLEALCKLMSTIGEMIDHYRAKVHMDFYFDIIQQLSANSKLSSRIRFMLEDVIDLRNNKWRQRRKVEGPKKIEEVHRDAVKQKTSQSTRSVSSTNYNSFGTSISSASRQGPPLDYGARGSSASRGSSQVRAYGSQNANLDRQQTPNRVMSVPVHQRRSDKSIRLSPQGELGREMSLCGKPQASHDILPDFSVSSHHGQTLKSPRQSSFTGATSNQSNFQATADTPKSQSWGNADHALPILVTPVNPVSQIHTPPAVIKDICYEARIYSEEVLQEKAILTIKEFYSAKDEKEVGLCMKELNAPSFYPSLISLWVNDSFERKDLERELLAKLLVHLCKSQESLLSQGVLLQGFQHVVSTLEDAVTDAPKATEFLGRLFAKIILEDVLSLTEIRVLLQDGGEEPAGPAPDQNLTSEVLGSMMETIRVEWGDSAVDEIRAKSNLQWESLRRPGLCV